MPLSRMLQTTFVLSLISFVSPILAQRPSPQQSAPQPIELPKPTRDADAISVLNRAVVVGGGMEIVGAVRDYRATGSVVRNDQGREIQGVVTINGSGAAQLRLDENLSTGVRSESMDSGKATTKDGNAAVKRSADPAPFMPGNFALPYRQLVTLLKDPNLDISYKGLVQADGRSVFQIRCQSLLFRVADPRGLKAGYFTKDFFIDSSTFQVVLIQDMLPRFLPRKIRYSDYRQVNGILVPYSLVEEIAGRTTRTIHLDNIGFNIGLQKTDFDISAR